MVLLFKMAPKHSAEMVSSIPKCKKAGMCLMEKTLVFEKLHSGMCYSAVGSVFIDNELTMFIT